MTNLDSPVTRVTTLTIEGRPVDVTLSPADPDNGHVLESIAFHTKGTQQRLVVPIAAILHAKGWTDDKTRAEIERQRAESKKPAAKPKLWFELSEEELQELEREFGIR